MIRVDSILIVDDNESDIFVNKTIIQSLNIVREIFISTNGMNALELIEKRYYTNQSLPSLILLDINMPRWNGFEFIQELIKSDLLAVKKIPVVLLTSSESIKDIALARSMGVFSFVTKPLTEGKLLNIIDKLLHPMDKEIL